MSRRCSSTQALNAWIVVQDAIEHPDYCIDEHDSASVTERKLALRKKIKDAMNIISSFIANPQRGE